MAAIKGRPEFRNFVEGRRFRNPDTENDVLYDSLPEKEQRRIYLEWWRAQKRQVDPKPDEKALAERRKEVEKTNPWAIPLWEYYDRVQEHAAKKYHAPGEIRTQTVESLSWMGPPGKDSVKIGERTFGDIKVDFYRSTVENQYTKVDEVGEIVRDPETGNALMFSEEEMLERGLPLFSPNVRAYVGDTPVGSVADEWGTTLVHVAEEYQRKGIGRFLGRLWRKSFPFKSSGGFSEQGLAMFKRVYQDFVREALESGVYEQAKQDGWMTQERFDEILESAGLDSEGRNVGDPVTKKPDPEGEKQEKLRRRRMEELADAYWKAKMRGDREEAERLWAEME